MQTTPLILLYLMLTPIKICLSACHNETTNDYTDWTPKVSVTCENVDDINDILLLMSSKESIIMLNISTSETDHLNPGIFYGYEKLREIHICHTNIKKINSENFFHLFHLTSLDLSFNSISEIDYRPLFVSKLSMSHNKLSDVMFLDTTTENNLEELDLSYNNILEVGSDSFKYCRKIKVINLKANALTAIEKHAFQGLTGITLLDLSQNFIKTLTKDTFYGLINMENLYLQNNLMTNIRAESLLSQINLKALDLQNNYLKHIEFGAFKELSWLAFLNLSHNELDLIEIGTFSGLKSLGDLDLSYNKISYLPESGFLDAERLEVLRINNNAIGDLNIQQLTTSLQSLRSLIFDGNPLDCRVLFDIITHVRTHGSTFLQHGSSFNVTNLLGISCIDHNIKATPSENKKFFLANATNKKVDRFIDGFFSQAVFRFGEILEQHRVHRLTRTVKVLDFFLWNFQFFVSSVLLLTCFYITMILFLTLVKMMLLRRLNRLRCRLNARINRPVSEVVV